MHPVVNESRSKLADWHRSVGGRKIAGVCSGVAAHLDVPVTLVRAAFIVAALLPPFSGIGLPLYGILWFLMPPAPGQPSGLDRVVDAANDLLGDRAVDAELDDLEDEEPPRRSAHR